MPDEKKIEDEGLKKLMSLIDPQFRQGLEYLYDWLVQNGRPVLGIYAQHRALGQIAASLLSYVLHEFKSEKSPFLTTATDYFGDAISEILSRLERGLRELGPEELGKAGRAVIGAVRQAQTLLDRFMNVVRPKDRANLFQWLLGLSDDERVHALIHLGGLDDGALARFAAMQNEGQHQAFDIMGTQRRQRETLRREREETLLETVRRDNERLRREELAERGRN